MTETPNLSFTIDDIPPDAGASFTPQFTEEITSDDPTCEVCGKALTYGGRGRKPKYCDEHKKRSGGSSTPRAPKSGNTQIDAAMAALSGGHDIAQFIITVISPAAGEEFEQQRAGLDLRNRTVLEASPDLAKRIATTAGKGGGTALVLSHAIAVLPALGVARKDWARRAEERAAAAEADAEVSRIY